jgi:cytochrome c oxidase cbb3-type subunit 1
MNLEPAAHAPALVDRAIVRGHITAGMAFFFVALAGGLLYALQLSQLYPFEGIEALSPGRIRMVHTNAVAFGFLFNLFFASLYWIVPRLTGHGVASAALSRLVFWLWQAVVLAATIGVVAGQAQAIEWGETPLWIDPAVLIAAILAIANLATPILRARGRTLYVSLWYFGAMMVWLPLTYVMGNYVPQFFVPGAGGAAVTGLYIHDLVGLTITPLGWGMMYYFIPVLLKRPIWSHTLSLVGFWGLAFFYPLNGVHHFLFSPIPMYAQYGAVVATIAVEIVVLTVLVNFFMTLRGTAGAMRTNIPLRWFFVGMLNYGLTCLQCSFQATLTFQKVIHFSDWVVGHSHLVMFGVFGFWCIGAIEYLWPKLIGRAWWSERLRSWAFWLCSLGLLVMVVDLVIAGLVQGFLWRSLAPWEESLVASMPFWHLRTVSGLAIIVGVVVLTYNMAMTARGGAAEGA